MADDENTDSDDFHKSYAEYARVLRTWLVAYGVGGPVLLLTNANVSEKLENSGRAPEILYSFLIGVVLQVLIALVNKWANWYRHALANSPNLIQRWDFKLAKWTSKQYQLDVACDILTVLAFSWATFRVLQVFT